MLSFFIYAAFLSGISPIRLYTLEITPFRPILCCILFVKNSMLSFLGRPSFFYEIRRYHVLLASIIKSARKRHK